MCTSWTLGSWLLEYIYSLLSLGPFIFGMPSILSPVLSPSTDPGVRLGRIIAPYLAHRFEVVIFDPLLHLWRIFIPFARSLHRWSPSRGGSGYVNVGSTPCFPSYVPSSTTLFPLNAVVMINHPYIL